jgi:nitrogen regulatory protein PII
MTMVTAVVQPHRLEQVVAALRAAGVGGLTVGEAGGSVVQVTWERGSEAL